MSRINCGCYHHIMILRAGRAKRKIDELAHLLDVAKMNYRQLGGVLDEDQKKLEEERESARVIRELEAQLEYEREKREKLEAQMDKLRAQIHTLTLQLQDERSRNATSSEFQRSSTSTQQTALRRKKKKAKRLDTTTSGIFVRRGVSSPGTIHCLDKDWPTSLTWGKTNTLRGCPPKNG